MSPKEMSRGYGLIRRRHGSSLQLFITLLDALDLTLSSISNRHKNIKRHEKIASDRLEVSS